MTTPTTATDAARRTYFPPASEDSIVPRETPTVERSASVIAATPTAASAQAVARSHGRALVRVPKATRPVAPAPSSTASPTYRDHRPAMPSGLGGGVCEPCGAGVTSAWETPTPNVNAPAVTWPSVAETVRQVTV